MSHGIEPPDLPDGASAPTQPADPTSVYPGSTHIGRIKDVGAAGAGRPHAAKVTPPGTSHAQDVVLDESQKGDKGAAR